MPEVYLQTGQEHCYDSAGHIIPCTGSGQDGELRKGLTLAVPRFEVQHEELVRDFLTGLTWTRSANLAEFPLAWQEALDFITQMNDQQVFGHDDWRMPNRREMRSLLHFETKNPALPLNHPFTDVILNWYWTATTAAINPAYAWYVHMEGARMFYGRKDQFYLVWPVRGESTLLPATGRKHCFDSEGNERPCAGSGEDPEGQTGIAWPEPRFEMKGEMVTDRLTGLRWHRRADLAGGPVSWPEALKAVSELNRSSPHLWRLPNINELESLVDCSRFDPALPTGHPFTGVNDVYWSSTTSFFEPDWAWALYLVKGATGVGVKGSAAFHVWPVTG
jgi:hypothetical protein